MRRLVILYLVLFLVGLGSATDSTTIGTLTTYPTFESAGGRLNYTGDDNGNNNVILEYRRSRDSPWSQGIEPYIDRVKSTVFVNLLYLDRNTDYDIRITFSDPDGVSGNSIIQKTFKTWAHDQPIYGSCNEYVSNDAELVSALSVCSGGGGVITLADGLYATSSITADGGSSSYLKIESENSNQAKFSNTLLLNDAKYIKLNRLTFNGGVNVNGASYSLITNNIFDGDSGNLELNGNITGLLVDGNQFRNICQPGPGQENDCGQPYEDNCIQHLTTNFPSRVVIRNNDIKDCRDGIGIGGSNWEEADIYDNHIYDIFDDGIETDGDDINVRVWGNYFSGFARNAISIACTRKGPIYFFNNIVSFKDYNNHAIKSGSGSGVCSGHTFFYYNTFYQSASGSDVSADAGIIPSENLKFFNNIMYAVGYWYESAGCGYELGYNNYDSTSGNMPVVKWHSGNRCGTEIKYNLYSDFYNGENINHSMVNELNVDSGMVDPANGDFLLRSDSRLIDAGFCISGITKDYLGNPRQSGTSCDIGAYEYISSISSFCGNNITESGEICDGTDLNGQSCSSVNASFVSGNLGCNLDCSGYNISGCVEGCEVSNNDIQNKIDDWLDGKCSVVDVIILIREWVAGGKC